MQVVDEDRQLSQRRILFEFGTDIDVITHRGEFGKFPGNVGANEILNALDAGASFAFEPFNFCRLARFHSRRLGVVRAFEQIGESREPLLGFERFLTATEMLFAETLSNQQAREDGRGGPPPSWIEGAAA